MTNGQIVGLAVLAVYAFLLGVGGVMGFVKAGSRPSLIAGLISAALAVGCLILMVPDPALGRNLGMLLALLLGVFFGYRYAVRPKFMPSGLMAIISGAVLIALFVIPTAP